MTVFAIWRAASTRTNVVRAVGLLAGVVVGLPYVGVAGFVLGAAAHPSGPPPLLPTLWAVGAVGSYAVSLHTLCTMPSASPRGRVVGLVAAVCGVLVAAPMSAKLGTSPLGIGGWLLTGGGVLLTIELAVQIDEARRAARAGIEDDVARSTDATTATGRTS